MSHDGLLAQLSGFYKAARHLWGRCPYCERLFRLPDARISHGENPPRDWLTRVERDQKALALQRTELEESTADMRDRMIQLADAERVVFRLREQLERDAVKRALYLAKSKPEIAILLKAARQEGVERSRSTVVGHFLERLAPFLKRFRHDPRDIRALMHPIDYVIFDGLATESRVNQITFAEVKVATSRPTPRQNSAEQAIREGRVKFELWQIGEAGIPISHQIARRGRMPRPR